MSYKHKDTLGPNGKKIGRPRKQDVALKAKPGKVGRPKGDATIINEYKARMLASPKSKVAPSCRSSLNRVRSS